MLARHLTHFDYIRSQSALVCEVCLFRIGLFIHSRKRKRKMKKKKEKREKIKWSYILEGGEVGMYFAFVLALFTDCLMV